VKPYAKLPRGSIWQATLLPFLTRNCGRKQWWQPESASSPRPISVLAREAARELGVRFHASRRLDVARRIPGGLPPDDCVEDEGSSRGQPARHRDLSRCVRRSMTQIVLAPCSPFSVTTSLLKDSAALARQYKIKLHTHLCETLDEERYTLEHFQLRPVDWRKPSDGWRRCLVRACDHAMTMRSGSSPRPAAAPPIVHAQHAPWFRHCGRSRIHGRRSEGRPRGRWLGSNDASNILLRSPQAMLLARLRLGLLPPEGPAQVHVPVAVAPGSRG